MKHNILMARQLFLSPSGAAIPYGELYLREIGKYCRILIDCGAYTEFSLGHPSMEIGDFIRWISSLVSRNRHIEELEYFALDVIGDGPKTRYNYDAMLDAGLTPIPIVTRGVSRADIKRYIDTAPKIAFGGIGGTVGKRGQDQTLRRMISQVPVGYPQHWLGFTKHDYMVHYRPASVDAVSWVGGRAYGRTMIYHGNLSRPETPTKTLSPRCRDTLRRHGFAPEMVAALRSSETGVRHTLAQCVTIDSYVRYAEDLQSKLGTRYYFAGTTNPKLMAILAQRITNGPCAATYHRREGTPIIQGYLSESHPWPIPVDQPCRHR